MGLPGDLRTNRGRDCARPANPYRNISVMSQSRQVSDACQLSRCAGFSAPTVTREVRACVAGRSRCARSAALRHGENPGCSVANSQPVSTSVCGCCAGAARRAACVACAGRARVERYCTHGSADPGRTPSCNPSRASEQPAGCIAGCPSLCRPRFTLTMRGRGLQVSLRSKQSRNRVECAWKNQQPMSNR